ncbi:serine hydrolase [Aliikangiella sp. G2MR2-5]|uniref:serine hydrolase n=1 Tax=Aliikangiella sp. G2MR2-5 TaxID=2788943 RepID=UPI0018AB05DA|nr:serine hydrolase [Aliikangiella sp. G2MR2-5]
MKNNKLILALTPLVFACSAFVSTAATGKTEEQSESIQTVIQQVENSLRASNRFQGDPLWTIEERMKHYGVPGVSLAVIKDYRIHWHKTYGVTDKETMAPVTEDTLFQAGSISKPVAAYGALKLTEQKLLSLDEPVNHKLEGWKIPENEFTKSNPVTLKHLMNHSSGLTVHGFWGYSQGLKVPTIEQVLDGEKPANSDPVRVDFMPGDKFRYSGGGYTVMQKATTDVTDKAYPEIMAQLVLSPIGMQRSSYEQPLPPEKLKFAAAGYLPNKEPVPGKRHVYPEMAAAGLWTTAEDLAKFAIDIQLAIKADKSKVLKQQTVEQMLTPYVSPQTGLGLFLRNPKSDDVYFEHGGWDEGFSADLKAHKNKGYGVVVMINSNHPGFINELVNSVASVYQWDEFLPKEYQSLPISKKDQDRISGRFRYSDDMLFSIYSTDDKVFMQYLNGDPMEVLRVGDNVYVRREFAREFSFVKGDNGAVNLAFNMGDEPPAIRARVSNEVKVPFEFIIQGQLGKAKNAYQTMMKESPQSAQEAENNIVEFAQKELQAGKEEQAEDYLKLAAELFPESAYPWLEMAKLRLKQKDHTAAMSNFKKALSIQPDNEMIKLRIRELETKSK